MALISAALVGLQLVLVRLLALVTYHHFAFFIISTAMLGYGASGAMLRAVGGAALRRPGAAFGVLAAAFALAAPVCVGTALALPLDVQFVFYSSHQAALLLAAHALIFIPFLLGAGAVGLALTSCPERAGVLYAASFAGSGAGAAATIGALWLAPPETLLFVLGAMGLSAAALGTFGLSSEKIPAGAFPCLAGGAVIAALAAWASLRPPLHVDPHKRLAILERLEAQGDARRIATAHSPWGRVDVFDSPRLHDTMFASLAAAALPPPQAQLLIDGAGAGPIFLIERPEQAQILQWTPPAVAFGLLAGDRRLRPPRSLESATADLSVLVLGETGGAHVWAARLFGADRIVVVQQNRAAIRLAGEVAVGGGVFHQPGVRVEARDPRAYLETTGERFDLIILAEFEAPAAGSSGLLSLHENYLLTVQGLGRALDRLAPGGLLVVTRGMQSPPRDNVKIFATLAAALEARGAEEPRRHLMLMRHYLAACTLASVEPMPPERISAARRLAAVLMMDVLWPPAATPDGPGPTGNAATPEAETTPAPAVSPPQVFHQPGGPQGRDWLREAAAAVAAGGAAREQFFRRYPWHVRPATDDRPFFFDFFSLRSLNALRAMHGSGWARRAELGFALLMAALLEAALLAAFLIALPLAVEHRRSRRHSRAQSPAPGPDRGPVLMFFGLLGLAYMGVEIVLMQRLTQALGEPLLAVAVVLAVFLISSGAGSLAAERRIRRGRGSATGLARRALAGILVLGAVFFAALTPLARMLTGIPAGAAVAALAALLAPLAWWMGQPFPLIFGFAAERDARLGAWAWAANGFCSVVAGVGAVALAMTAGFTATLGAALVCYGGAWLLVPRVAARKAATGGEGKVSSPAQDRSNNTGRSNPRRPS
ncbi:MAG: hypothetical protein Kow0059_12980 [Candidatus Sumerlaeia bacterium]